jgi:hypothetical protein
MKPILKQPHKLMLVNATLFLLFALVVLGGVYFANTAFGESALAGPTKVPGWDWNLLLPAKQTVLARTIPTVDPNAPIAPRPVPTSIWPTLVPQTGIPANMPHRVAGAGVIVENSGGAPLDHDYSVVNEWYTTTNSEKIWVYAGGIWDDPLFKDRSQGFVSVTYQSLDYSRFTRPQVFAETQSKTGALTIVDATGMTLKLQSDQGVTYYFDVNAGKFVSH